MGATTPNGHWAPSAGEPIDWHITPTLVGAAADNALSGRSDQVRAPRTLASTSALETATLKSSAPLEVGDRIYRTDLAQIEGLKADGWKLTRTLRAVAFTPEWPNLPYTISPGNAQQAWSYWLHDDIVTVTGVIVFGSTTTVGQSSLGTFLPLVPTFPARTTGGQNWCSGEVVASLGASIYRGSLTGNRDDILGTSSLSRIILRGGTAQGNTKPMAYDFPGSWGQNAVLAFNYQYQTY